MKRLSPTEQSRRDRLRRRRRAKSLRRIEAQYVGDLKLEATFPETFSFSKNPSETVASLKRLKEAGHSDVRRAKRIRLDLTSVRHASAAAILVLSAEIDRIYAIYGMLNRGGVRFTLKSLPSWNKSVVARLEDMNFFSLVGVSLPEGFEDHLEDEFSVLPMMACTQFLPKRVVRLTERLRAAAEFFEQSSYVYEAVVEAIHNTSQHAYPADGDFQYRPVEGAPWWATAAYSTGESEVRVMVFDQGVGIPATLTRWGLWEQVRGLLAAHSAVDSTLFKDEARMIQAALEVARTSRDRDQGRGQGLQDVVSPIEELGGGRLRILSGKGGILYTAGGSVELLHFDEHIGGTLIEWRVPVTINREAEAPNA